MTLNEIMMTLEIGLIYGMVALGVYLTFRIIDFPDLTCDGSFVLGAAVSSILIKLSYHPWFSLVAALGAGALAGVTTGLLYTKFKITNLLAGILVSFMLYSINLHILGGMPNITLLPIQTIFSQTFWIPLMSVSLFAALCLAYLLKTDFGLGLRALGQNKRLAQNSGLNVPVMTVIGLALGNGLIAFGGALFSHHQGFCDIGSGIGTVIVGLASVMIGERILPYQSILTRVLSCLGGSILYRFLIGFALHGDALGLATQDLNLVTGVMVIAIMAIPRRQPC